MAGGTKDWAIRSRAQRAALLAAQRKEGAPHNPNGFPRAVTDRLALYYLPSKIEGRAGKWRARLRPLTGAYVFQPLGTADDLPGVEADGAAVLSFDQAEKAARAWAVTSAAESKKAETAGATTVADAMRAYVSMRKRRDAKAGRDAELRLTHHVLAAPLASVALASLNVADLKKWRTGLKRGGKVKSNDAALAESTLARLLNDVRAALTEAQSEHRIGGDFAAVIKEGLKAPSGANAARAIQILRDEQVQRIVAAAREECPDFGALVCLLAATGCRFGQANRITVGDLQPAAGRVMVPKSKKGRGKKSSGLIAVPLAPDALDVLLPLAVGRAAHEPLLMRWQHKQVPGTIRWERKERVGWGHNAEMARMWDLALKQVGLGDSEYVPYALRHSSIVRLLQRRVNVRIVAAAHDTSVAMIEAHYSAHIVEASDELLRASALNVSAPHSAEVVPLRA